MSATDDPRLFGGLAGRAATSKAAKQPQPTASTLPGEGVSDTGELIRLMSLLRAAEIANAPKRRDLTIGEFIVSGARVPERYIAGLLLLSRNEAAALRFLGWGRTNADIATLLDMTESTVRTHMTNAIRKLALEGIRDLNSLAGLLFMQIE
jgi:DNA-binding CsgD family transcriptional regulator